VYVDELLGGESCGPHQVPRAPAVDEAPVDHLPQVVGEVVNALVVALGAPFHVRRVLHGADQGLHHAQGVETGGEGRSWCKWC
jgi:hypothetical protein